MAWPRPYSGIGVTAMPVNGGRSSRRSSENRLAAAAEPVYGASAAGSAGCRRPPSFRDVLQERVGV
jgi:hypothetical protein